MADLLEKLVLYWKRGIVLHFVPIIALYILVQIAGIGAQIMGLFGRAFTLESLIPQITFWVLTPMFNGWLAGKVISWVKE